MEGELRACRRELSEVKTALTGALADRAQLVKDKGTMLSTWRVHTVGCIVYAAVSRTGRQSTASQGQRYARVAILPVYLFFCLAHSHSHTQAYAYANCFASNACPRVSAMHSDEETI